MDDQVIPDALRVLPAGLPEGWLVAPDRCHEGGVAPGPPVMWVSKPVDDADVWWRRLYEVRDATGLRPVLLGYPDVFPLPARLPDASGVDVESYLLAEWQEYLRTRAEWAALPPEPVSPEEDEEEYTWPDGSPTFDTWPGLAARAAVGTGPGARAADAARQLVREHSLSHLALVPVTRSADIPAAIGWGMTNGRIADSPLSAVLRSWEDRFGARLVALSGATAYVSVAAPPTDLDQAHRLALEHYLVCPDIVEQSPVTFTEYAEDLLGQRIWPFWWD